MGQCTEWGVTPFCLHCVLPWRPPAPCLLAPSQPYRWSQPYYASSSLMHPCQISNFLPWGGIATAWGPVHSRPVPMGTGPSWTHTLGSLAPGGNVSRVLVHGRPVPSGTGPSRTVIGSPAQWGAGPSRTLAHGSLALWGAGPSWTRRTQTQLDGRFRFQWNYGSVRSLNQPNFPYRFRNQTRTHANVTGVSHPDPYRYGDSDLHSSCLCPFVTS